MMRSSLAPGWKTANVSLRAADACCRYELLGRGIEPESVEAATREIDDRQTAVELARNRARKSAGTDYATFFARSAGISAAAASITKSPPRQSAQAWAEQQGPPHSDFSTAISSRDWPNSEAFDQRFSKRLKRSRRVIL